MVAGCVAGVLVCVIVDGVGVVYHVAVGGGVDTCGVRVVGICVELCWWFVWWCCCCCLYL